MDSHTLAGVSLIIRQSDIFCGIKLAARGKLYFQCLPSCVTATWTVGLHVGIVRSQCGSAYRFLILIGGHPPQYGVVCAVKKLGSPPPEARACVSARSTMKSVALQPQAEKLHLSEAV